jgi:hypothetical protein
VSGVAALATPEAGAHDVTARCRKLTDPARRRACLRRARAHKRNKHACEPKRPSVICGKLGRCSGVAVNNCGKLINCTCPKGKTCLGNGSCARSCPPGPNTCPASCICIFDVGAPFISGTCMLPVSGCPDLQPLCASDEQCPPNRFCLITTCGPNNTAQGRCAPLCG